MGHGGQIHLGRAALDVLAFQLTAALEAPLLLYLSTSDLTEAALQIKHRTAQGWQDLVQRVCLNSGLNGLPVGELGREHP
jgi:hypothetical protein